MQQECKPHFLEVDSRCSVMPTSCPDKINGGASACANNEATLRNMEESCLNWDRRCFLAFNVGYVSFMAIFWVVNSA